MIPRVYVVGPQYLYQRAKVSRNHQLLVAACHDLRCKAIIFDKCIISDNYISGEVHQGYPYMLKKMSQSAINIVPCKNRGTNTGLCGLTSVIDGLALGMPLLIDRKSVV